MKSITDLNGNQAKAIRVHAKKHEYIPLVYIPISINNLDYSDIVKAGRAATQQGVIAFITASGEEKSTSKKVI